MARAPAKPAAAGRAAAQACAQAGGAQGRLPRRQRHHPRRTASRACACPCPSLESGSTRLRKVILNIAFVLAILIFMPILAGQFLRNPVLIEPIAVPEALVEPRHDARSGGQPPVGRAARRQRAGPHLQGQRRRHSQQPARAVLGARSRPLDGFHRPPDPPVLQCLPDAHRRRVRLRRRRLRPEGMRLRLRVLRGTSDVIDLPPGRRPGPAPATSPQPPCRCCRSSTRLSPCPPSPKPSRFAPPPSPAG